MDNHERLRRVLDDGDENAIAWEITNQLSHQTLDHLMGLIQVAERDKPTVALTVLANLLGVMLANPPDGGLDLAELVNDMLAARGVLYRLQRLS
jgi:hypothetical protein